MSKEKYLNIVNVPSTDDIEILMYIKEIIRNNVA